MQIPSSVVVSLIGSPVIQLTLPPDLFNQLDQNFNSSNTQDTVKEAQAKKFNCDPKDIKMKYYFYCAKTETSTDQFSGNYDSTRGVFAGNPTTGDKSKKTLGFTYDKGLNELALVLNTLPHELFGLGNQSKNVIQLYMLILSFKQITSAYDSLQEVILVLQCD